MLDNEHNQVPEHLAFDELNDAGAKRSRNVLISYLHPPIECGGRYRHSPTLHGLYTSLR